MKFIYANNADTTLTVGIDAVTETLQLANGSDWPVPTPAKPLVVTLQSEDLNDIEIVHATNRSGNVLTVVRAQDGTTPKSFLVGALVEARLTRENMDSFAPLDDFAAHVGDTTNPHSTSYNDLLGVPATFPPSAHTHPLAEITDSGTAASRDVPAAGNAGATEVVLGSDTRLTDSRPPDAHNHVLADVTDSGTAASRDVPAAGNAGATEVVLGSDTRLTDARTPVAHTHVLADVTDSGTAASRDVPAAGNAGATEVVLGSDTRLTDARTPVAHTHVEADITDLDKYTQAEVDAALAGKEDDLGNPTTDGYILSSTAAGARSWVENTGGGGGGQQVTIDVAGTTAANANGTNAAAIGNNAQADGANGIALGRGAYTGVETDSIAIGSAGVCEHQYSISIGTGTQCNGDEAIAVGRSSVAMLGNSVAVGASSRATQDSVAVGHDAEATALNSIAIGSGVQNNVLDSIFIRSSTLNGFTVSDNGQMALVGSDAVYVVPNYSTGGLPTTPPSYSLAYDSQSGELKVYDGGWDTVGGGGGATAFTDLTDTPPDYAGQSGKYVTVGVDQLVFTDPPSGAGEANRGENLTGSDAEIYAGMNGVNLTFRELAAGSAKLTVTQNANNIAYDVDEGNIVHQNLNGAGANTHAQIDAHIAATDNPHSVTAAQAGADPVGSAATVQGNLDTHIGDGSVHFTEASIDKYTQAEVDAALAGKEDDLGNPASDGYILSSTAAGARSWVENTGGGSPTNLGNAPGPSTVTITSSTGSNTVVAGAVSGTAGMMTGAQVDTLASRIAAADVTYENLNTNGDVGTGATQVAQGDHLHPGVYDPAGSAAAVQGNLDTHIGDNTNPHAVTATQVGAPATDPTGITGAAAVANIVSISQANYDAIGTPDPNTLFLITG